MSQSSTRQRAQDAVDRVATRYHGYSVVRLRDIETLIGPERTSSLLTDPIRKHGPRNSGSVYEWNVVDAMQAVYDELQSVFDEETE